MAQRYDVIVIGSGVAGGTVARQCRSAGLSVALAESRAYGGTCPLKGCNPKKVLVGAAEVITRSRELGGKGIEGPGGVNWPELMDFKSSFTDPVPRGVKRGLKEAGVAVHDGPARFTGPDQVRVAEKELSGRHLFIGSGAVPRPLGVFGEEYLTTSDRFLELETLPGSIVFIGGGYISFEFAHIAARAGARATILQRGDRVLKGFDPDLVPFLVAESAAAGIQIRPGLPLNRIEKAGEGLRVVAGTDGEHEEMADLVVHGAGRVPDIGKLDLAQGNVDASEAGIRVNRQMQSISNPSVYAAGDAAETPLPLTPTAALEAEVAAHNIIHGDGREVDHSGIPSVVFSIPPLARAGLLEAEADERGLTYEKKFQDTSSWFSSKSIGLNHSGFKLLIEPGTGKLLGAHILGNHAEEVINIFALAIRLGLTAEDLERAVWSYPSSAYEIKHMLS